LNRYPQLKSVFSNYLSQGYFENVELEYVPGMTPTAYFYDDNQYEIGTAILNDVDLDGFKQILSQHGFELRRPRLPEPVLTSELTESSIHYQFYGSGKLYHENAEEFASSLTHNGEKGRLLTIRCKAQEAKLDDWIKKFPDVVIWLGASDKQSEGYWKWSNGDLFWMQNADVNTASTYSNWRSGEPNNADGNEHCATYLPEKGWNDVKCDSASQIIVEFGPETSSLCETEPVLQHVQASHDQEL